MRQELSEDLQFRILALLDGDLDEEEVARLDSELCDCREARDLYQELALLHVVLEEQTVANSGLAQVPVIPIERLLARQRRRLVKASLLAAAAVLLVSALIFHFKSVQTQAPLADFRLGPDSVFTLTHAGDEDEAPPGKVLGKGSRLQLARGTLEAEFDSGVRCVIEAPCDLTVLADDRISVAEGIAWFEVPSAAVGFTVETPQFTVVDLGTEFGVVVRAGGEHELHVTKGSVEMRAGSTGKTGRKLVLKAGHARRVATGGGWHEIPAEAAHFTTVLPEAIPIVNASFELDRNPDGVFQEGQRVEFGGQLTGWIARSGRGGDVQVGWRDTVPSELHPHPAVAGRMSQVLSLISGASVLNVTGTPWSGLRAGDRLTLTVSLGLRGGSPPIAWSDATFFGLTDASYAHGGIPTPADTVTHSALIAVNPATGSQSGDGTFRDVSLDYTVREADLKRPGNVGILLVGNSSQSGYPFHQSFFDHVRLHRNGNARLSPPRR